MGAPPATEKSTATEVSAARDETAGIRVAARVARRTAAEERGRRLVRGVRLVGAESDVIVRLLTG
ncbi:hypothetical protein TUSST3_57170 [Streptomyces sp. TUS-ST3]|nr:hypothetical protein TUSST3_57170 [Streptomyces sp. TUS-ST3]